jgi:hypothetical protein
MRFSYRFLLIAVGALMAIAPSATAQTLEVVDEATSEHCSAVAIDGHDVNGGCQLHASGTLRTEFLGVVVSNCNVEFTAHVGEDGSGYISDRISSGAQCTLEPCSEMGATEPTLIEAGESGPGERHIIEERCERRPDGTIIHCITEWPVFVSGHDTMSMEGTQLVCNGSGPLHVTGHFDFEGLGVEATHL